MLAFNRLNRMAVTISAVLGPEGRRGRVRAAVAGGSSGCSNRPPRDGQHHLVFTTTSLFHRCHHRFSCSRCWSSSWCASCPRQSGASRTSTTR